MGINDLVDLAKERITNGIKAYGALQALKQDPNNLMAKSILDKYAKDLGYALLLKRYTTSVVDATPAQIQQAADDTVPNVPVLFWSFRIMVAIGFFMIGLFAVAFYLASKRQLEKRWFLRILLLALPLPWISSEMGWIVAEHGRQPWAIDGVLPTYLGTSSLASSDLWISLAGFVLFYTTFAIVEVYLMIKYIRLGPDGLEHKSKQSGITNPELAA